MCTSLITCEHSKAGHSVDNAKGCMAINEKTGLAAGLVVWYTSFEESSYVPSRSSDMNGLPGSFLR